MKFGQLIGCSKRNIFLQNYAANEAERLVRDLFLLFKKALYEIKQVVCSVVLIYFDTPHFGKQ